MPNNLIEYGPDPQRTGQILYAEIADPVVNPPTQWNTATPGLEAYNAAHWTSYTIQITEGTSKTGYFYAATPAALPAGIYLVSIRAASGGAGPIGSALPSDQGPGGGAAPTFEAYWDGTAWHASDGFIDGTRSPVVRNQDGITAPTYDDCMVGAWCEAFGKETESDSAGTYVKQKPDNSAPIRSFTLSEDVNGNPVGRS